MTQTITRVGSASVAAAIAEYHHGTADWLPGGVDHLATGSQRTVYVDYDAEIVYKLGIDGANRQEVSTLSALRASGVGHAPAADLHEVTVADLDGDTITATVVAMPYLPDDGSVTGPYPILDGAADLNPAGNVVANGGQLWLIDAGGL
jgi:hypothetical protein